MTVDAANAKWSYSLDVHTWYFCGNGCMTKFAANPQRYLALRDTQLSSPTSHTDANPTSSSAIYTCPMHPEVRRPAPGGCPICGMALELADDTSGAPAKTEYTCPMHPEVIQDHPGSCPKCGMALEPRTVVFDADAADAPNPEFVDMTRRFWISSALALPLLALSMSEMIPGMPIQHALGTRLIIWIELTLATPVVLWGAIAILRARRAIARQPSSQYVHVDLARRRNRIRLQRLCDFLSLVAA